MKRAFRSFLGPRPVLAKRLSSAGCLLSVLIASGVLGAPPIDSHFAARTQKQARTSRAYLSSVGPAPLRVEVPTVPVHGTVLPPLAMNDTDRKGSGAGRDGAGTKVLSAIPSPTVPASGGEGASVTPNPLPAGGSSSLLVGPGAEDASVAPIVTPSMLVPYFRPVGGNAVRGVFALPVFVPPTVPTSKPSSATYRSN